MFEFVEGEWVLSSTDIQDEEVEWDLKGTWSFDIYTYYIDLKIKDVDFKKNEATVQVKGSIFEGMGNTDTRTVGFSESNGALYFDTFVVMDQSYYGTSNEVTLTAKLDDMYYKAPSIFNGAAPVDMAVGGKK